jgi:hypothetical protein
MTSLTSFFAFLFNVGCSMLNVRVVRFFFLLLRVLRAIRGWFFDPTNCTKCIFRPWLQGNRVFPSPKNLQIVHFVHFHSSSFSKFLVAFPLKKYYE